MALVFLAGWDIIRYDDDPTSQPELVATVRGGHVVTTADGRYAVLWAAIRFSCDGNEDDQSRCAVPSRASAVVVILTILLAKRRVLLCAEVLKSGGHKPRITLARELTQIQVDAITKVEKNTAAELIKTCEHLKNHDHLKYLLAEECVADGDKM